MGRPRRARAARPAAMPRTGRSGVVGGSSSTATQLTASPAGMGPDKMTDEPTRHCPRAPRRRYDGSIFRNVLIKRPPRISILR